MDEAEEVVQHDGLCRLLVPVSVLQHLDAALVVDVDGEADVPVGPGQGVLQQVHLHEWICTDSNAAGQLHIPSYDRQATIKTF